MDITCSSVLVQKDFEPSSTPSSVYEIAEGRRTKAFQYGKAQSLDLKGKISAVHQKTLPAHDP